MVASVPSRMAVKRGQDRFVRLKYDKLEAEHPLVWFDPTALATYARLLALCDQVWPSQPELPVSARRSDLALLRTEGLLVDQPHRRFTLKGYAKDRGEREAKAKAAAGARWDAPAHASGRANGHADAVPTPVPEPVPDPEGSTRSLTFTGRDRPRLVQPSGERA